MPAAYHFEVEDDESTGSFHNESTERREACGDDCPGAYLQVNGSVTHDKASLEWMSRWMQSPNPLSC